MAPSNSGLSESLEWLSNHLSLVGWPSMIFMAIRTAWKASHFVSELDTRAKNVEASVANIRDNHLAHIQAGIQTLNEKMDHQTNAVVQELRNVQSNLIAIVAGKKE